MSYTPIFGRRASRSSVSSRHQSSAPDFGAFEEPSDGEEDAPILGRNPTGPSSPRGGRIALGDDLDDPLTAAARSRDQGATSAGRESFSLPGGYDFEPQANEGGPAPSSNHHSRPSPSNPSPNSALGAAARSYQRPLSLRERLLPAAIYSRLSRPQHEHSEDHGLLFSHDGQDEDTDTARESTYPPRGAVNHVPLPARPPQFAAPPTTNPSTRIFGGGQGNDGVFANLSAKPDGSRPGGGDFVGGDDDGGGDKDEVLPSYQAAALDSTPPYWETTVITPGGLLGPDDICVDGLPVGNLFGFAWNMLVSMSFQFVGFLLTYLLHTTHAAKNGSRAGLGITLIQLGFYLKQRAEHPELMDDYPSGDATGLGGSLGGGMDDGTQGWTWWGGAMPLDPSEVATSTLSAIGSLPTQIGGALAGVMEASDPDVVVNNPMRPSLGDLSPEDVQRMSQAANEWMAFMMVTVGSFLLIGAFLSYWRAVRWARAVRAGMGPVDAERVVE